MNRDDQRPLELLEGLGYLPATPFYEDGPARYITAALAGMGIAHNRDRYGNIVAALGTPRLAMPPVALVAHMDHPGFEIMEVDDTHATARAVGGVPIASLVKSTPVIVLLPNGDKVCATTKRHGSTLDSMDRMDERLVTLALDRELPAAPPLPVVFDLPDFELDGNIIRMRALDDLAGCAAILAALERASKHDGPRIYGVFTRAEEGGLFGARLLAGEGTLPSDTMVVSVESSAVIPGVEQGKGPVIRTGDAATTFNADAEWVLSQATRHVAGQQKDLPVQRQLMSGGICEASAFADHGYRVTGLAFPLGNYHNATTSISDPESRVAAEYITLTDFLGGVDLLTQVVRGERSDRSFSLGGAVSDDVRQRLAVPLHIDGPGGQPYNRQAKFAQESDITTFGSGDYRYEMVHSWPDMPRNWAFGMASDAAVNSRDEIHVFSRGLHPLTIWTTEGAFLSSWGEGEFSANPHGIYIAPNDNVWLVDRDYHIATEHRPDGTLIRTLGNKLAPSPSYIGEPFNMPSGLAIAPTGDIFVSDGYGGHRVHKFNPNGELVLSWGSQGIGPGEFALLHNIWVDPRGRVLICDRENHRIQFFDSEGRFLEEWTDLEAPGDIWIRDGSVYVVEQGPNCGVSIWTLDGDLITRWRGNSGSGKDEITAAHGICVDSQGNIYVTEIGDSQRVRKFQRL